MSEYEEKIRQVCDYVQQHLGDELPVEMLSDLVKLSKFHFHRLFSVYTGISLVRYVRLLRLKRASFQLAFEHQLKIIDIAFRAGFDSHEAFARAFKRTFEQTPRDFRASPDWPRWHTQFKFVVPYRGILMSVAIVNKPTEKIAYLSHYGDPDRVLETAAQFIAWRKESGLSPLKSSNTYGVPYADPKMVEADDFRFDLCGTVESDIPENNQGVKVGLIPGGRCAVLRHKGSHDNLEQSVYFLYREWLPLSGEEIRDYPVYFQYLNFIHDVDECDLLTDIHLPLK